MARKMILAASLALLTFSWTPFLPTDGVPSPEWPPPSGHLQAAGRHLVDPALVYSTFLGGAGSDIIVGIATDPLGNVYVTGSTNSEDFPVTPSAFDTSYNGGSVGENLFPVGDAFVAKFSASGELIYATYLGGAGDDTSSSIAVDIEGNAYLTGDTFSADFPTTRSAFDRTYNGGGDAWLAKLDSSGSRLLYSTYFGGSGTPAVTPGNGLPIGDFGRSIALDGRGAAYVTGGTVSTDFPTTSGAFDSSHNGIPGSESSEEFTDAFFVKFDPGKSGARSLVYSTFIGGASFDMGHGIAVDVTGMAYIAGRVRSPGFPTTEGAFGATYAGGFEDGFAAKFDPSRSAEKSLLYSTFIGGSRFDLAADIDVDDSGNAYVTGATCSTDFPTTPGAFDVDGSVTVRVGCVRGPGAGADAYILKLNPTASALSFSTYLGGNNFDLPLGITVDAFGTIHVVGNTNSGDFPTTSDAFDPSFNGGSALRFGDAFLSRLTPAGTNLEYSSFLGGTGEDNAEMVAVDVQNNPYVVGETTSWNFPVTQGAFDPGFNGGFDGFIAKLHLGD